MKMYIAGQWVESPNATRVISSYSQEVVDTVPDATPEQVEQTLAAAEKGAGAMAKLTGYERSQILNRAADIIAQRAEDFARTISLEQGKPLSESRVEASRAPDLLRLSAFEGTQARGESLPLDAQVGTRGKRSEERRVGK